MALLERINSMKQSGISEAQIINTLSEEGIPPLQINEAISQLKIKAAVASNENEMQPSAMSPQNQNIQNEIPAPSPNYAYQQYPQDQTQQYQEQYAQEQYPPQNTYYQQGTDIETVKDIAKQVLDTGMEKIKEEISSLSKIKTDLKFEIQSMENRLTRIESVIQELQTSIIRKMGQYGESISSISQEIKATQDSFSKVINPLLDKQRGIKSEAFDNSEQEIPEQMEKIPQEVKEKSKAKNPSKSQISRTNSSGVTFEDYFR